MSWSANNLGPSLVVKQGDHPVELVTKSVEDALAGKKRVGLYFSAHWCPPCRSFTPLLAEFYNDCKDSGEDELEIVFVSSDSDRRSFREYFVGEMPWLAIPYDSENVRGSMSSYFGVQGIPTLIIVDPATGRVLDKDGRSTVASANGNVRRALVNW